MTKKESVAFLLPKDQKEIVNELSNEEAGIIFKAIYEYETNKKEPKLNKILNIVFKQFKIKLDSYDGAYEEKCLKNKENAQKRWKEKNNAIAYDRMQMHAKENKKENIKINKSKSKNKNKINSTNISNDILLEDLSPRATLEQTALFSEILSCFNKIGIKEESFKTKKEFHFKNTKSNQQLIQELLDQGYTKEDIFDVIYLKYDQWIENNKQNKKDMSTYYRPSTILGDKFDEYLQEAKMKEIS